jgi:hypothetical protein
MAKQDSGSSPEEGRAQLLAVFAYHTTRFAEAL